MIEGIRERAEHWSERSLNNLTINEALDMAEAARDDIPALLDELAALRAEREERRRRAEAAWTYPPIADLDRANAEVCRLRAYIAEYASAIDPSDTNDPEVLRQRWHGAVREWGAAAMDWYRERKENARLRGEIAALEGLLVALEPDTGAQLAWLAVEHRSLTGHIRGLKRELARQMAANAWHKRRVAALRAERDKPDRQKE